MDVPSDQTCMLCSFRGEGAQCDADALTVYRLTIAAVCRQRVARW